MVRIRVLKRLPRADLSEFANLLITKEIKNVNSPDKQMLASCLSASLSDGADKQNQISIFMDY